MDIIFKKYRPKAYHIEVVEITPENIETLAKLSGGTVFGGGFTRAVETLTIKSQYHVATQTRGNYFIKLTGADGSIAYDLLSKLDFDCTYEPVPEGEGK